MLVNQEEQSRVVADVARTVVDPAKVITRSQPKMGSEDFADMLHAVPGAYFWLGHDGSVPVHNPGYIARRQDPADRRQHVRAHHRNPLAGRPPMHKSALEETSPDEAVTSLHDLSAVDLIAGFRAKQFSPSEVLEDVLAHIAVWEPHIKALYAFDPEGARADCQGIDRTLAARPADRPARRRARHDQGQHRHQRRAGAAGRRHYSMTPAAVDAPPAARLREAGAVIFAKTTMPDYGMLSSGLSSFHPLTRNPWDLSKNPGGSSSGAGAAGAAGYGPLHLGTDIGGSVRLPACWCGLVALKPSLGRIPIDPPYVGRVAGPMTRTVDDAALMMSVLSKPDRRDGMSLPSNDIHWKALDKPLRKLRIGLMLDLGVGQALEQEVRDVAVKAAKAFEAAGAVVTEVDRHADPRNARRPRQFLARADVGRSFQTHRRASAARRCPIS